MKVFITGASGNVGREVSKALAKAGHELVLLSRSQTNDLPDGSMYYTDLADTAGLSDIITKERPDIVIHLAAMIGGACEDDPHMAEQVNVEATKQLARLSAKYGVARFIFTSSAAVYNQLDHSPTDEQSNIDPQSVYGKTKLAAEQALGKIAVSSNLLVTILRPFNIYGPEFTNSLVYKLAHSTPDSPVILNGLDTFYRDYIHIDDVVKVLSRLETDKQTESCVVYNVASGVSTNNATLIAALEARGREVHYNVKESPPSYSWADIHKAQTELGFQPDPTVRPF